MWKFHCTPVCGCSFSQQKTPILQCSVNLYKICIGFPCWYIIQSSFANQMNCSCSYLPCTLFVLGQFKSTSLCMCPSLTTFLWNCAFETIWKKLHCVYLVQVHGHKFFEKQATSRVLIQWMILSLDRLHPYETDRNPRLHCAHATSLALEYKNKPMCVKNGIAKTYICSFGAFCVCNLVW